MRKADKIVIAITALVAAALIVAVVVGVVLANRNRNDPEPDVPVQNNSTDTDTQNTEIPGTDIPVITPGTEPGGEETEPSDDTTEPGHVSVDILEQNKENEKDNTPHIVGEPSILPGVKEATDETQN